MAAPINVGFYGKIPSRGDFISRRVSREFSDYWDAWLQNALSCSRTQLSNDWLNVYLTSPIWRFVLSPGMCGQQLWMGVVMPSVDKVGRYFPLTIVTPLAKDLNPFNVAKLALNWFNNAEAIALSTLAEQSFDFDSFDKQVEALAANFPNFEGKSMGSGGADVNSRTSKGWRIPVRDASSVDQSYTSLLWQLTNNRFSTYSLWWCDGSEHIEPSMLVSDGLPSVESYAAMLDGKWQQWSWNDCPVQFLPDEPEPEPAKVKIQAIEPDPIVDIQNTAFLNEPVVDDMELPNEPMTEIQDDWWLEEPDQLAKDAKIHLANNIYDDTPESLVLKPVPIQKEDSMEETMIINAPDSVDESYEKTQLFSGEGFPNLEEKTHLFNNDEIPELTEKTMLLGELDLSHETIEKEPTVTELFAEIDKIPDPKQGSVLGVLGAIESTQDSVNDDNPKIKTISSGVLTNSDPRYNPHLQPQDDLISDSPTEFATNDTDSEAIPQSLGNINKKLINFNWVSAGYTDKGKVREINEDALLDRPKIGLWVVADGVGGHKSGEIASQMIVQQLGQITIPDNLESFIESVQSKLQYVNRYLLEKISNSEEYAVGSTVAALLFYGGQAACVWAGDSRIYLNRDGKTTRLTQDHSMSEEQDNVEGDNLNATLEPINPNIITRAIGAEELLELDIEIMDLQEDDAFLLCSDGLYKEVSEEEISEYLNREDSQVISQGLLDLALMRNARDNVTVISVLLSRSE